MLTSQYPVRNGSVDENPKKKFIIAQTVRPMAMNQRGLAWSPKKPLTNFETP
jgi:hypothetical protein